MVEHGTVEVFPLALFLADEIEARGWKTEDVAIRMGGRTYSEIARDLLVLDLLMCVQDDAILISGKEFDKLARAFGVSSAYLRNLDAEWRKWPDRRVAFSPPDHIFGPASRCALIRPAPESGPGQ